MTTDHTASPPLDAAALDAIEARAEAATPGPWRVCAEGSEGSRIAPDHGDKRTRTQFIAIANGRVQPEDGRNAAFIAAARTDVPALLAEVRRLQAALDEWASGQRRWVRGVVTWSDGKWTLTEPLDDAHSAVTWWEARIRQQIADGDPAEEVECTLAEFRRQQWAAALRWEASGAVLALDHADAEILHRTADQIESGTLTPEPSTQPAQSARERPADADAHPGTGGGAGVVLGRVIISASGRLWTEWLKEPIPVNADGLVPALLVPPEAGRVLDAARVVADAQQKGTPEWLAALRALTAAVYALGDPQQPLQVAPAPPTDGAGSLGVEPAEPASCPTCHGTHIVHGGMGAHPCPDCTDGRAEPAPEPDSGPGWDRHAIERIIDAASTGSELGVDVELNQSDVDQLRALLADRDRHASWLRNGRDARTKLRAEVERLEREQHAHEGELGDMRAQLSATEADLDGVVLQRDRLLAERATARRDAAADALAWARGRGDHYIDPTELRQWAAEIRNGTRPVPGSPEPAGDGGGDDG